MSEDNNKMNNNQDMNKKSDSSRPSGAHANPTVPGRINGYNRNNSGTEFASEFPNPQQKMGVLNQNNPSNMPMKSGSGLHDENDGLNDKNELKEKKKKDKETKEQSSENVLSKGMDKFLDKNEEKTDEEEDIGLSFKKVFKIFKKIPVAVRIAIGNILLFIGSITAIILIILVIGMATVGLITEAIGAVVDFAQNTWQKITNFFSGNGWNTDEEALQNAENNYYEQLDKVYLDFNTKYSVEIDLSLITATLFHDSNMGESMEEEVDENGPDDKEDEELEEPGTNVDASEYKRARKQIKKLANYQLVKTVVKNSCVHNESDVKYTTSYESAKQFADSGQKQIDITNTILYDNDSFISCPYEDVTDKFTDKFNEDKDKYETLTEEYNEISETTKEYEIKVENAKKAMEEADMKHQPLSENYKKCLINYGNTSVSCLDSRKEYDSSKAELEQKKKEYNDIKTEYENYLAEHDFDMDAYKAAEKNYNLWLSEGLFNEEGDFTCKASATYGSLFTFNGDGYDNACVLKKPVEESYKIDIEDEGVYYFRLAAGKAGESFIEKFYYDSEKIEEKEKFEVIDEIYAMYDSVAGKGEELCYTPSTDSGSYTSNNVQEFATKVGHQAVTNMNETGILASYIIADAAIKSSNGKSVLAQQYKNYYNVKAGVCAPPSLQTTNTTLMNANASNNTCLGNAFWDGSLVWYCPNGSNCDWYRKYDSFSNSTYDYSAILSSSSYMCQGITNINEAAECAIMNGNNKDQSYFDNIINTIYNYNLTQYDIGTWDQVDITEMGKESIGTVCGIYTNQLSGPGTISNGTLQGIRTILDRQSQAYFTYWYSDNNRFYAAYPDRHLVNECTWYAHGRALEILTKNGMPLKTAQKYLRPMSGNAVTWYDVNAKNNYFSSSTNVNDIKVGAIIVWENLNNKYGHVAIVENIEYNNQGKMTISISEGGQSLKGFRFKKVTLDYINSHASYRFKGYVFLLD